MSDQIAGKQERYGIQINIWVIMKVEILGQEYEICMDVSELEDTILADCDGYTDRSTKRIIIAREPPECELKDFNAYKKVVIRHELIHAFLLASTERRITSRTDGRMVGNAVSKDAEDISGIRRYMRGVLC